MPRTTTSALLKTQQSRQREIWSQQDAIKDYEWTLSDKSPEAFAAYTQHYKDRMNAPQADGDKMLTYQKRITSANKSYTSNEIQRASIDIIEGRQPEEYKIQVLENMYRQAYEIGDMDLAQGLRYQLDNQYVQQQNRQLLEMAAYGRGGYGGGGSADLKSFVADVKAIRDDVKAGNFAVADGGLTLNNVTDTLAQYGTNKTMELLAAYGIDSPTPMAFIQGSISNAYEQLREIAGQIPDETEKQKMLSDINAQVNTDNIKIGGKNFSLATLEKLVSDEAEGNPSYRFKQGSDGQYTLERRDNVKFQFRFDENGEPIKDALGRSSVFTQYGDNTIAGVGKGYQPDQAVAYEIDKFGNLVLVSADKAYGKDGKIKKGLLKSDELLASSGLTKKDGSYLVTDPYLSQQLKEMGFTDSNIDQQNIKIDEYGTVTVNKDGRLLELYKNPGEEKGRFIERIATSPTDWLGGRVDNRPTTTDTINGAQMYKALQNTAPGAAFQGADTSRIVGTSGGAGRVLQSAANATQLNNIKVEQLRVQAIQRQEALRKLQVVSAPAPITPLVVSRTAPAVQLRVYQPPAQPQLRVTTPAPSLRMTSGGGNLQGAGGSYFQGGSGSIQGGRNVFQGGFSGSLRVR
jgi:hypothetical protein